jgi:superfamily II DNA or RNA helicase
MQELFEAVKEACTRQVWSRGVELVRAKSVSGEKSTSDEVLLRVSTRQGMVSPLVTLYPVDEDWECTCKSTEDPCEHIAAATIALRQARMAGDELPMPQQGGAGRLRYRFSDDGSGELLFEREIVGSDSAHTLTSTLDAIASGRVSGPRFLASPQDLTIEHALGSRRRGALPRESIGRLFDALAGCDRVMLGDRSVSVSSERVLPHGRVVDAPGGVRLYVEQDPTITRIFNNSAVLCGDTLRAVGINRLTGRELEELPRGRFFADEQLAELVTDVLPELQQRIPIEIESVRLPSTTSAETPRIALDVQRDEDRLSILPTLVYGEPPVARIDAGRLLHIRGPIPIRDEEAESACVRRLQQTLGLAPGRRVVLDGAEAIELVEKLGEWTGEITGGGHAGFRRLPELAPQLRVEGESLALTFTLPTADATAAGFEEASEPGSGEGASAASVLSAWKSGATMISLGDAGFAPLPGDWLARFGHRVVDLLDARQEDGSLPTSALPDLGRLCAELDQPPPPRLERLAPLLENFDGIPAADLPDDLTAELRPYQRRGIDWLCFLRDARLGGLLADDMGLGKTLQTLCALQGRSLVVVPTSLLHNWSDELERFRPTTTFALYYGPKRRLDPDVEVVLTSYALLRLDRDVLCAEKWTTVVLDEAQHIKNPDSQVAQAAYALDAEHRVALTGTPIENRLEELWSQLHFLNRGLLGGRQDFQQRYARPIAEGDAAAAERLRERLRPFVLRRLKRDVAPELPPRTEVVLHCELSTEEREVYDAVRAASVADAVQRLRAGGNVMAALEALLRLRQAACHAGLVPGQNATGSSKIELLIERLEQAVADGHKALVFSQWTGLLDRVEPHLRATDIPFIRLDGSTRNRADVVRTFQGEDGPPVMIVSLKAGGSGLNLTAADHVFLLDPWWNPAVEDQAADRAHRIGQTRPVVIHRIVANNTVEERILALHASKRALAEAALSEGASGEGLNREDLLTLLDD